MQQCISYLKLYQRKQILNILPDISVNALRYETQHLNNWWKYWADFYTDICGYTSVFFTIIFNYYALQWYVYKPGFYREQSTILHVILLLPTGTSQKKKPSVGDRDWTRSVVRRGRNSEYNIKIDSQANTGGARYPLLNFLKIENFKINIWTKNEYQTILSRFCGAIYVSIWRYVTLRRSVKIFLR
jgi:hypothetical protein